MDSAAAEVVAAVPGGARGQLEFHAAANTDRMSSVALPPRKRKMAMAIAEDASDDDRAVKPEPPRDDDEPQVKKKPTRQGYRIGRKKPTPTSPAAAESEAVPASPPSARVKEEPAEQETKVDPGEAGLRFGSGSWQAPPPPPPPPRGGPLPGGGPPPPPSGGPPSGGPPSTPSTQAHARVAAAQAAAARLASRLAPLSDLPTPAARPNSKFGSVQTEFSSAGTVQPSAAAAPMHGRLPQEVAAGGPPPPQEHDPARYKRQLCRYFEGQGRCPNGGNCTFAHGQHEIQVRPAPSPSP